MKPLAHKYNEQGITLIEILVCIVFLTTIIGPLTLNLTTAHRMLGSAQRMSKTIGYSEILMNQLHNRLTWDIAIKRAKETHSVLGEQEEERYEHYVVDYLSKIGEEKAPTYLLEDYLGEKEIQEKYATDEYRYEAFICPINEKAIGADRKFVLTKKVIEESGATILYSNNIQEEMMEETITFEIPEHTYKAFIDKEERYIPSEPTPESYPVLHMKIAPDGKISSEGKSVLSIQEYKQNVNTDESIGSTIIITSTDKMSKVNLVKLDATALTSCSEEGPNNKNYTLKVENHTGGALVIKVVGSGIQDEEGVEKKLRIISTLKDVTVEYIDEVVAEQNYLIALVVRDKQPLIGDKDKKVKKRVQIYSYDPMIQKGW